MVALFAVLAIVGIACPGMMPSVQRIFYNPSDSAPRGWYWLTSTRAWARGTLVLVKVPDSVAALADQRRYLPLNIPLLKPIAASTDDAVCEADGLVRINGEPIARALHEDARGRPLTPWRGCLRLAAGQLYLLSSHSPASFDSRYFGPVNKADVLGRAIALWTW